MQMNKTLNENQAIQNIVNIASLKVIEIQYWYLPSLKVIEYSTISAIKLFLRKFIKLESLRNNVKFILQQLIST